MSHQSSLHGGISSPLLLTSWDDGSATDLRLAELLSTYGFRGTFFATARPVGTAPASDQELREIVGLGHDIGNHGISHKLFTALDDESILTEAALGAARARDLCCAASHIIAPPGGRINNRVLAVLEQGGYRVRTAPIVARAIPHPNTLEPTCQVYPHTRARTIAHILKRRTMAEARVVRPWFQSHSLPHRLFHLLDVFSSGPDPLHFWGHSAEIASILSWRQFELVLERAQALGFAGATLAQSLDEGTIQ